MEKHGEKIELINYTHHDTNDLILKKKLKQEIQKSKENYQKAFEKNKLLKNQLNKIFKAININDFT